MQVPQGDWNKECTVVGTCDTSFGCDVAIVPQQRVIVNDYVARQLKGIPCATSMSDLSETNQYVDQNVPPLQKHSSPALPSK